ncbi:hypothetical protein EON65_13630 [archaeon]|nr:MAG: hypothetical protein EON65_13630 [archaeon]
MFGNEGDIRGVIPRSIEYLFQALSKRVNTNEVAMVCSFLEIYNDQIRDLGKAYLVAMGVENSTSMALYEKTSDIFENLAGKRGNPYFAPAFHRPGSALASTGDGRPGIKEVQDEFNTMNYEIREDNEGNVFVKDLSLVPVTTMEEVMSMINMGLRVRATHETKMNAVSSRSHTVFNITVLQRDKITGQAMTGMLNLVDLAGSERIKKSESQGIRLKEALHINTSLTALGKVIMALDSNTENGHVPYRDSKLTRVLQNSLGGNSFTSVIAAVHPCAKFYEECLSTLQFANRCRNVRNNPRVNYIEDGNEDKDRRIRKLVEEINVLRSKLSHTSGAGGKGGEGGFSMQKLVAILKALGMSASLTADGCLMLNGKKYTMDDLGLGESSGDGQHHHGATGEGGRASKDAGGLSSAQVMDKLQKTIKELKESNEAHSIRSKERKMLVDEQAKELQKLSTELVKCKTTIKHKEFEYTSLMEDKDRALTEQRQVLESKFKEEMDSLIQSNKEILQMQQVENDKIPAAVKEYTQFIQRMDKQRIAVEGPLRVEFEKHLQQLEKARLQEIDNIRKQYEHFLTERDKALSGFVDAFNTFRAKKTEQLRMAEREIVRLYDYTEQIEEILDNVEKGKYQVRQKQGHKGGKSTTGAMLAAGGSFSGVPPADGEGFGAIVLPKGLRPMNPLKMSNIGGGGLELTRRIVARHKERVAKLDKMKEEAFQKSLHYAAQTGATATGNLDEHLRKQVQDLLIDKDPSQSRRKSTSPGTKTGRRTAMEQKQVNDNIPMPQPKPMNARQRNLRPNTTDLSRPSSFMESSASYPNIGMKSPNATAPGLMENRPNTTNSMGATGNMEQAMLTAELMQELGQLRLQAQMEEITTQKVLNDLSKNETFQYIQNLQEEVDKLRNQLMDVNSQLQAAKVIDNNGCIHSFRPLFGANIDSVLL